MNKRLLTFDDLYDFYSKYKKSMKFDSKKAGEPIVVQTEGKLVFEENNANIGLTSVRLQACHTERNLNSSSISYEVMEKIMLPTFKNRPILGYIHHEVDNVPNFADHRMHMEDDEIVYDEKPIGIVPETNNAKLEYDEKEQHYNVFVDGYIFDEYSEAKEIIEREKECSVSVEISINSMSYNAKEKCLIIEDGYFSGVTILGVDENGNEVKPGMAGSNIKLKDFSEENNSLFSSLTETENSKLIDTLEKLNNTLSKFNIDETENQGKEDNETVEEEIKEVEEITEVEDTEVVEAETESTEEEVTVTETEEESEAAVEETPEVVETEACGDKKKKCSEDEIDEEVKEDEACGDKKKEKYDDSTEGGDSTDDTSDEVAEPGEQSEEEPTESVAVEESEKVEDGTDKKKKFSFELSHEDIRCGIYELLEPYCEADNDWYWISEVYDTYFVYEGCYGKVYRQDYSKNEDTLAFEGERVELFKELLTASEKAELETLRSNYSSVEKELSTYKEAELMAKKEEILSDEAYLKFAETEGFKTIKEKIAEYSLEELRTACDLQFAKEVKTIGAFSLESKEETKKKPSMFAFGAINHESSFLDSLLKK